MNTWIYIGGYNKVYRHEYMDIHWRVTTRFTDMNTWIYIGSYNKVYRHEYMDIHWRLQVTTRFTFTSET